MKKQEQRSIRTKNSKKRGDNNYTLELCQRIIQQYKQQLSDATRKMCYRVYKMCIANIRNYCANDRVHKASNVELKNGAEDLTETAFSTRIAFNSGTDFAIYCY